MLNFKLDMAGLEGELATLAQDIAAAAEAGEMAVAERGLAIKKEEAAKSSAGPIPTSKNGKPKYRRKGAFVNGQAIQRQGQDLVIVTQGEAAAYEERLATLPTARRNPAAERTRERLEEEAGQIFEDAVATRLKGTP